MMRLPVLALVALLMPATAHAQKGLPYDWSNVHSPDPTFGGEFCVNMIVVDIDHDGFGDLVATDAFKPANGQWAAGKAFVLYGPTLTTSKEIVAQEPAESETMGRWSIAVGDVDADGEYDILLGGPGYDGPVGTDCGRAHLFLGPDHTTEIVLDDPRPEPNAHFGQEVVLADLDGDGLDDVAVSAPDRTQKGAAGEALPKAGHVWVWRGSALASFPTAPLQPEPLPEAFFGTFMGGVPGVGESRDVIVSAPQYPPIQFPFPPHQGYLYRYRLQGPSMSLVDVLDPSQLMPPKGALFNMGRLASMADVDADGHEDLLLTNMQGQERAALVRGPGYRDVMSYFGAGEESTFGIRGALSDLDADGNLDVVLSDYVHETNHGAFHVYWGPDFSRRDSIGPGYFPFLVPGLSNGLVTGDLDGDGYDEMLVQAPGGFSGGSLYVFRRRTLQADEDELSLSAGASIVLALDLPPEWAGHAYVAGLSLSDPGEGLLLGPGSWVRLQPDVMTSVGLLLLGTPMLDGFSGVLDDQGDATLTLNWPPGALPELAGQTLHVAAITASSDGVPGPGSSEATIALVP